MSDTDDRDELRQRLGSRLDFFASLWDDEDSVADDEIDGAGESPVEAGKPDLKLGPWHSLWVATMQARRRHEERGLPLYEIGHFEAIRLIGRGGLGVVFEVRDPKLDRRVALKLCMTRGLGVLITREAQLSAKVSHPNVITVHETGEHEGELFFVMELILGVDGEPRTAHDVVLEHSGWEDAVTLYIAAGSGLAAAHEKKIVHGDFKPGNILIDQTGRPRVSDFGLARVVNEHASVDELEHNPGTRPYMAPEVLRGQPSDMLSDQWSFCVSLWETLRKRAPFSGATTNELLEEIERVELGQLPAHMPGRLAEILRRGLAVDPAERYPNMTALLGELEELQKSPPDEPLDIPPRRGSTSGGPRGLLTFLGIGGIACVLLGLLLSALVFRGRSGNRPPPTQIDSVTDLGLSDDADDHGETDAELEEIRAAVEETLALIEGLEFEQANRRWFEELTKPHDVARLRRASFEIAQAFLSQAAALKNQAEREGQHKANETRQLAKAAGEFAFKYALEAQSSPGEANTPAAALVENAISVLDELRR